LESGETSTRAVCGPSNALEGLCTLGPLISRTRCRNIVYRFLDGFHQLRMFATHRVSDLTTVGPQCHDLAPINNEEECGWALPNNFENLPGFR